MTHAAFTTTTHGLRRDLPPMRLFEKAKRYGIWNPSEIDFSQDRRDWLTLAPTEQDILLRLTSMFQAGEEAVTLDLLPLVMVIAQEGRLEEEMFLTTFLWEEAKHTDFFRRFLDEVVQHSGDLSRFHTPNYAALFYQALPAAMNALVTDRSPAAQTRASVTYNMIVEGVLAETGYHAYYTVFNQNGMLPGQVKGIGLLKQDESRHIAYGVYLISRLLAQDAGLWAVVEDTMNELLPLALGVIGDTFACYDPAPFGLTLDMFTDFALGQFQKRMERIERARGATLDQVIAATQAIIEQDSA
jgi:ribonucleoside-diphosphate reductase beta chain